MKLNKKHKSYLIIFIMFLILVLTTFFSYELIYKKRINNRSNELINEKLTDLLKKNYTIVNDTYTYNNIYDEYLKYIDNFNNTYTIDKPYIVLNPFDNVYNSALIMFNTEYEKSITLTIKGRNNDDIVFKSNGYKHIMPIYGLYLGENNITINDGTSEYSFTIINNDLKINSNVKVINNLKRKDYFINMYNKKLYIYDSYGNIRWFFDQEIKSYSVLNNHLIINLDNTYIDMDLIGYIYKECEGNIPEIDNNGYYVKDNIIYNYNNDNTYNINDILKLNKKLTISQISSDNDGILIYLSNIDSLIKIDNDGNILYIIGDKYKFGDYKEYALKEKGYNFIKPKNISNLSINNNEIAFKYNNKLIKYLIDDKNVSISLKENIDYEINNIDIINGLIYTKNQILDLNNNLDIIMEISGKSQIITFETYDYQNLEKINFITNAISSYEINDYGINKYIISKGKNVDIILYNNILKTKYGNEIALVSKNGIIYKYESNKIDISKLQNNIYYIFVLKNDIAFNTLKYIEINNKK